MLVIHVLQLQLHGGDGRFDLMCPQCVVTDHILIALGHLLFQTVPFFQQHRDDVLIVSRFYHICGWKFLRPGSNAFLQPLKQYMVLIAAANIDAKPDRTQHQTNQCRVHDRRNRQMIQRKGACKDQHSGAKARKHAPPLIQISPKKRTHISLQSNNQRHVWLR